ncbi:MAG: DUF2848 domain-containing protein [Rhodospirillaceae bacterium]|nr:DUF2848 domain-containing protein [Rhodospirillaceae bacterium]MBT6283710.1 DUF2848 domain-containing protein [Rhodospirillaceae bacterium]
MPTTLEFTIDPENTTRQIQIDNLVIAGWTGRNVEALEKHIVELEELGVPRPSTVPCFYRVATEQFINGEEPQFLGETSSGEVEFVLIGTDEGMLIGVGSDHTDREVETYSVPVSKQMCVKPVSSNVWRYDDVADHFDDLLLRAWATENGEKKLYQDGGVTAMRPPEELIGLYMPGETKLPAGTAMYCGTLAAIGGIRPAQRFDVEIEDPVLGRKLSYGYNVNTLPVVT